MKAFRLEELLRVTLIAAVAVIAGIAFYFAWEFFGVAASADPSVTVLSIFVAFTIFFVSFPSAVLAGIALHLALRLRVLPRAMLLPIFVGASYLVGCLVSNREWVGFLPLVLSIGLFSWFLYSFGPFRLWRFEFEPDEHSDF
jgi:hypothetical protein